MGNDQSNTASLVQNIENKAFSASDTECIAFQSNIISGDTIDIPTVGGNVEVIQKGTASASCIINQNLDSQVQNIMSSIANQENSTVGSWISSFPFNKQNNSISVKQNITNQITQVMEAMCQGTQENLIQDTTIIGKQAGGNFVLSQEGNAQANCTINNTAKIEIFNKETSKTSQGNKTTSLFALIFIAIIAIVIIGAIIAIIVVGPAEISKLSGGKSKIESEEAELATLTEETQKLEE